MSASDCEHCFGSPRPKLEARHPPKPAKETQILMKKSTVPIFSKVLDNSLLCFGFSPCQGTLLGPAPIPAASCMVQKQVIDVWKAPKRKLLRQSCAEGP
jgi:hypothetical protein